MIESLLNLSASERRQVYKALELLDANERHPSLRVHKLAGELAARWSASASDALRIEFVRLEGGQKLLVRASRHYAR